jgi:hypothetical protein
MTQEVVTLLAQEDWPMDQLQTRLDALEQQMHAMNRRLRWWRGLACGLLGLAGLTWALPAVIAQEDAREQGQKGLAQRVAALEQLLEHFSREKDEIFITGANLHLVNGLGSTGCFDEQGLIPDCPNGLGNLIVGYNELRTPPEPDGSKAASSEPLNVRTGSHNVVVGLLHNFSRFGGLVVGVSNTISGDFAAVSGGFSNVASGFSSSVSGGGSNQASGSSAVVSGGNFNTAGGEFAAVVSGGFDNTASGFSSSVSGGSGNTASGEFAVVSGGANRTAAGEFDWVAGSLFEDE